MTNDRERLWQTIKQQAHETLERTAVRIEQRDPLAEALARPLPDPVAVWRDEANAQQARFAQERRKVTTPAATSPAGLESWLRARLDAERAHVLEAVGQAIGTLLRRERGVAKRELSAEVRRLRIEITAADETVAELRKVIESANRTSTGGAVIDLPSARRAN